jgi:hypothetical protein
MELDPVKFEKKSDSEPILNCNKSKTLLDFWQWAYSDLVGNTERGILAEYLVALACNIENYVRISWDSFDLLVDNSIKVEVKSSAYLQSWKQTKFSKPIFGIAKTKAWDYINNTYENQSKRQADIYVFALLSHLDKVTLNPLDLQQWEFYVLSTRLIDIKMNNNKTISLERIIDIGATRCYFESLYCEIVNTHRQNIFPRGQT